MKALKTLLTFCLFSAPYSGHGQLMTNNGAAITIKASANLYIKGALENKPNTTIDNEGTIYLSGNWTHNAANNCFGTSEGTVILNGGSQIIGGSSTTLFHHLTTAGSAAKVLQMDTEVGGAANGGVLTLNQHLDLNAKVLTVKNPAAAAIVDGGGKIISENQSLDAKLIWKIGTNTDNHLIPFGNALFESLPVSFQTTAGIAGDVTFATYKTPANNLPLPNTPIAVTHIRNMSGLDNDANMPDRYWLIQPSGNPTATLQITHGASEQATNGAFMLRAQRWDPASSDWNMPLAGQTNAGFYDATVPGVANWGIWAMALNSNPLPITLQSFTATPNGHLQVLCQWITASEINNDYFELQHSVDALSFNTIATIAGAGNTTTENQYQFHHLDPIIGINYYRLKQTDFDGAYSYSQVIPIAFRQGNLLLQAFPNPAMGSFQIVSDFDSPADTQFLLIDQEGRIADQFPAQGMTTFYQNQKLAAGVYTLKAISLNQTIGHTRLVLLQQ